MTNSIKPFLGYGLLVLLFFFPSPLFAQEEPLPSDNVGNISIQELNTDRFPTVEVKIAAFDPGGVPIRGLVTEDFFVTEDDETDIVANLEVSEQVGPLHIHFLIDAGAGLSNGASDPRWENTKGLIENFVNEEMDLDQDSISISVVDGVDYRFGESLLEPSSNPNEILDALSGYTPPFGTIEENNSNIFAHLDSKIKELAEFKTENQLATIVVVSGTLLNNQTVSGDKITIDSAAASARALKIPVHTVLVKADVQPDDGRFQDLGMDSNGIFVHYPDTNTVGLLYQTLDLYRLRYLLQYDSMSNAPLERAVQIRIPNSNRIADGSYNVELRPPEVMILSPQPGASLTSRPQTVEGELVFGDGFTRRVSSGTLFVNGEQVDEAASLDFSWTPEPNESGGTVLYKLEIEITDILGFVSTSEIVEVKVDSIVAEVEADGERDLEGGTSSSSELNDDVRDEPAAGTPSLVVPSGCFLAEEGGSFLCRFERFVFENGIALLAIMTSLLTILYISRSNSKPAQNIRETIAIAGVRMTKQISGSEPLGYLEIVAGDGVTRGRKLPILGDTAIGRSREKAQLLFHQNVDDTPISRLHCSILDHDDGLYIRDEGSTHGTFLNRKRLSTSRPILLKHGDEIELAQVEQGGIRLKFEALEEDLISFNAPLISSSQHVPVQMTETETETEIEVEVESEATGGNLSSPPDQPSEELFLATEYDLDALDASPIDDLPADEEAVGSDPQPAGRETLIFDYDYLGSSSDASPELDQDDDDGRSTQLFSPNVED